MALTSAILQYVLKHVKAKTLIATHYHELNVMPQTYPQIKNYRVTISENDGEIEFLRKIVPGSASKSYGIHVAKMAGLPNTVVKINDLVKRYGDLIALDHFDLEIKQGEVAAIVGPSGSGKSTIARLIDSLWDVDSGSISYGGVNIKKLPLEYYMSQIAYVAQDNYLFDLSVKENIRLGKAGATDEDVINAAKATGCHD